jgi:hypothetical protein
MTLEIVRGHPKVPVGGWSFRAHNQSFRGKDVDEVIAALTAYRTQNSLPLGNPEAEIADYYASISPWLVREAGSQPVVSNGLRQSVAEHTMATWYGKYERLPGHSPIVAERLAICQECPYAVKSFDDPETSYWNDAATKASLMTGDMAVTIKGWCRHHKFLLGLATRLVTPQKVATMPAPAGCWLPPPVPK